MNIFYLDSDPIIAAQCHINKHCPKMVLESAQILSTVHHKNAPGDDIPYKKTHQNHPCVIWAETSKSNYGWLLIHAISLASEYTYRYDKVHKSEQVIRYLWDREIDFPSIEFTSPALAMPDEYKTDCPVQSYRNYYLLDKIPRLGAKWGKRPQPSWFHSTKSQQKTA